MSPSTDSEQYEAAVFQGDAKQGLQLRATDVLPYPDPNTPLRTLVEFKRTRQDELLRLRSVIQECQERINAAESLQEAQSMLHSFKDEVQVGVNDLFRAMSDRGITSMIGSLRAVFGAKSPAWIPAVAAGIAGGVGLLTAPVSLTVGALGALAAGTLELASYGLSRRKELQTLTASPYSYLIYAKQEGITR